MLNRKIELLDHGFARLVDSMGSDLSIARSARVSYDADWRAGEDQGSDARLIGYLMRNGHNTPFESVTLTVDIKAPIFVFRQWHRHRTWSYNELSARYRPLPEEFYIPKPWHLGKQSNDNKQMRDVITEQEFNELPEDERKEILDTLQLMRETNKASFDVYKTLLTINAPRELARGVLPLSTYSHMFGTVNLHNLFRFISERSHEHAQYEIRVYSNALLKMAMYVAPIATNAFIDKYDLHDAIRD